MKITSELLENLGFEFKFISEAESGDSAYSYWTLDLSKNNINFCLITDSSDEVKDDHWPVYLFEVDDYKFENALDLMSFLTILTKVKK